MTTRHLTPAAVKLLNSFGSKGITQGISIHLREMETQLTKFEILNTKLAHYALS